VSEWDAEREGLVGVGASSSDESTLRATARSSPTSFRAFRTRDAAECPIKVERVTIVIVGRYEHVVDSSSHGALEQSSHETPSDPLSLLVLSYGNVVDEDFGLLGSRHWPRMGGEPADDHVAEECVRQNSRNRGGLSSFSLRARGSLFTACSSRRASLCEAPDGADG